jgi:hypothetical protein
MTRKLLVLCAIAAMIPAAVQAQTRRAAPSSSSHIANAWGPRVGFSSSPDQVVVGGQLDLGELAPDLTFSPNIEFGAGDNVTVIAFNGDVDYRFRVSGSSWRPYLGAGLGVNHYEFDVPFGFPNVSDTKVGLNIIVGAIVPTQTGSRFFAEARLGSSDLPDFKLMVGWNFKM